MSWYIAVLKKYAVFTGRARRKEYWMFFLFNAIISFILAYIGITALKNLYSLAVFIPGIAVSIRRMHDTDHRGWWILLPIVNIVFLVLDSQPGKNRFGENPKIVAVVEPLAIVEPVDAEKPQEQ
ncbi:MAG: DUF805 domain-containing protein [Lentisphaeria bacterium]